MEQELNSEMLENIISVQLSNGCDRRELIRKIEDRVGIAFILRKSLSLYLTKCTQK